MPREPITISTIVEGRAMSVVVVSAQDARLVTASDATDDFSYTLSNALVGNPLDNAALEVRGEVELESRIPTLMAVTGSAKVLIGGSEYESWRALPLPPRRRARVKALEGVAYVALSGLKAAAAAVGAGAWLGVQELNGRFEDLAARYVPSSMLREYLRARGDGEACRWLLDKILRHLRLASEMARRGAKLIKVRVGEEVYDVWVEELR
ncbi:MAG: hypothetical protein DRK00_02745 [Thermoprotei archaeon]|nr:MAG: hypothetical protein DRK00_02745 [Thermoprotei archaeon]